jgi:hypothetical protein
LPPGGAWRHLAPAGTPADEVAVARTLLTNLRLNADPADRAGFAILDEALEAMAATTQGLPESFVHPTSSP